jgi:hypothetical protein
MHFLKFRALLATARIANVPSVLSNIWLGVALGSLSDGWKSMEFSGEKVAALSLAGVMLYIAGNFLNDWADRAWDQQHRPERALPSRLFAPKRYRNIALILIVAGVLTAGAVHWLAGGVAILIVSCIAIYTIWHKRAAWAVIPMGFCRGLLPMMGALGTLKSGSSIICAATLAGIGATSLFCYIVGLSMSARNESIVNPPPSANILPRCLFITPAILMMATFAIFHEFSAQRLSGVIPYLVWIALCLIIFRKPISKHVSALLAGIPLVDWIFLLPFGLWMLGANHSLDPASAACLLIPPLAFIAALFLQKVAPAT